MEIRHKAARPYRLSRRGFLGTTAAAVGAAALPQAARAEESIVFWQYRDPPDSAAWKFFEGAAERFKQKSGISVQMEFKSAEGIEQAVAAAANAKEGFDALLWWSGPTARNQGSLGNVIALDDKFPADTWSHKAGLAAQRYDGKTYGMTYTIGTYFLVYNKEILRKAGVDPDSFPSALDAPPEWDMFLEACEKVKANAGIRPLMWANKEGYFNEWYFYNLQAQSFDSAEEIGEINLGPGSWQNQGVYDALNAYKQLYDKGFFQEGGEVVPYEQHVRQLASGQAAMSVYFDIGGATAEARAAFGEDNIGFSRVPAYRKDKKLYGHSCLEPNSFYVASFSQKQEAALKWVDHLVGVEELNQYVRETQLAPGDDRYDRSLMKDAGAAAVFGGAAAKGVVYPYTFVTQAQYNSLLQNGILFLTGQWTAEQLAADWDKVDAEYLKQQQGG